MIRAITVTNIVCTLNFDNTECRPYALVWQNIEHERKSRKLCKHLKI